MGIKRSAREIKEMEFAQKNADEAIKRHMDENLELLRLMNKTIEKWVEVQNENTSLITTIEQKDQFNVELCKQLLDHETAHDKFVSDAYDAVKKLEKQVESLQKENERWDSLRPEVQWFAEQMEATLKKNDHKGGWGEISYRQLKSRLDEEVYEVELAYYAGHDTKRLISEATDVANFAMMIADNSRIQEGESHE